MVDRANSPRAHHNALGTPLEVLMTVALQCPEMSLLMDILEAASCDSGHEPIECKGETPTYRFTLSVTAVHNQGSHN